MLYFLQVYQYYDNGPGASLAITSNLTRALDDIYIDIINQTHFLLCVQHCHKLFLLFLMDAIVCLKMLMAF